LDAARGAPPQRDPERLPPRQPCSGHSGAAQEADVRGGAASPFARRLPSLDGGAVRLKKDQLACVFARAVRTYIGGSGAARYPYSVDFPCILVWAFGGREAWGLLPHGSRSICNARRGKLYQHVGATSCHKCGISETTFAVIEGSQIEPNVTPWPRSTRNVE
jgi:hypothetical protein